MNTGAAVLLSLVAFTVGVVIAVALGAGMFWLAEWLDREWRK